MDQSYLNLMVGAIGGLGKGGKQGMDGEQATSKPVSTHHSQLLCTVTKLANTWR